MVARPSVLHTSEKRFGKIAVLATSLRQRTTRTTSLTLTVSTHLLLQWRMLLWPSPWRVLRRQRRKGRRAKHVGQRVMARMVARPSVPTLLKPLGIPRGGPAACIIV